MSIMNYEIGGNEIKPNASEAIADIPSNRTMVVEKLTADDPVNPEMAKGLTNIEQVFGHFKPQIAVDFQNEEGQEVKETFHFKSVADFSVKSMTEQSAFLKQVSTEKEFYETLTKQLRTNKVLQKALENAESKEAFVAALQQLAAELELADNN